MKDNLTCSSPIKMLFYFLVDHIHFIEMNESPLGNTYDEIEGQFPQNLQLLIKFKPTYPTQFKKIRIKDENATCATRVHTWEGGERHERRRLNPRSCAAPLPDFKFTTAHLLQLQLLLFRERFLDFRKVFRKKWHLSFLSRTNVKIKIR